MKCFIIFICFICNFDELFSIDLSDQQIAQLLNFPSLEVIIDYIHFPTVLSVHDGKYDIVQIVYPTNGILDTTKYDFDDSMIIIFFVEANITEGANYTVANKVDHKGVYIYTNFKAHMLMPFGTCVATDASTISKVAFIGARDGIYVYNPFTKRMNRYGNFRGYVIDIAKAVADIVYVLTADHVVYQVTNQGWKADRINIPVKVLDITLDFSDNLYVIGDNGRVYVRNQYGWFQVRDLPPVWPDSKLILPIGTLQTLVGIIIEDRAYIINSNGSAKKSKFRFYAKPTAFCLEGIEVMYFALDRKIYEYNLVGSLSEPNFVNELDRFTTMLDDNLYQLVKNRDDHVKHEKDDDEDQYAEVVEAI